MKRDDSIFRPILLADALVHLPRVLQVRGARARGAPVETALGLRCAELLRRFHPSEALRRVEPLEGASAPPDDVGPTEPQLHPAAIRAHALCELGRTDAARLQAPDVPERGGVRSLIIGRIGLLTGSLRSARIHLDDAVARAQGDGGALRSGGAGGGARPPGPPPGPARGACR